MHTLGHKPYIPYQTSGATNIPSFIYDIGDQKFVTKIRRRRRWKTLTIHDRQRWHSFISARSMQALDRHNCAFFDKLEMAQIFIRNDHAHRLTQVRCNVNANTRKMCQNIMFFLFVLFSDLTMLIKSSTSEGKGLLFTSLSKHDWKEYYFYQFKNTNINWIECYSQVYMVLTVKPGAPIYSETRFEPSVRLVTYLSSQGWWMIRPVKHELQAIFTRMRVSWPPT